MVFPGGGSLSSWFAGSQIFILTPTTVLGFYLFREDLFWTCKDLDLSLSTGTVCLVWWLWGLCRTTNLTPLLSWGLVRESFLSRDSHTPLNSPGMGRDEACCRHSSGKMSCFCVWWEVPTRSQSVYPASSEQRQQKRTTSSRLPCWLFLYPYNSLLEQGNATGYLLSVITLFLS